MVDERARHPGDIIGSDLAPVGLQAPFDQPASAGTDHVPRGFQRNGRQSLAVEHVIEGIDQVRRGVDERAVEVENDGAIRGHFNSLTANPRPRKWPGGDRAAPTATATAGNDYSCRG